MGHVRDLPESASERGREARLQARNTSIIKGKEKLVNELKKAAAKSATECYLATDPDREGEAISWHLAYICWAWTRTTRTASPSTRSPKPACEDGHGAPPGHRFGPGQRPAGPPDSGPAGGLQAQPASCGKKIRRGLSAGRVQSVAVRLIVRPGGGDPRPLCPQEYWTHRRQAYPQRTPGKAVCRHTSTATARSGRSRSATRRRPTRSLTSWKEQSFLVTAVKKGRRKKRSPRRPLSPLPCSRRPPASWASRPRRTMKVAQELYEGVDVEGMGAVGLITYMRTDSLRISDEALRPTPPPISRRRCGNEYLPARPRRYKTKAGAQDGHEAIRPHHDQPDARSRSRAASPPTSTSSTSSSGSGSSPARWPTAVLRIHVTADIHRREVPVQGLAALP